MNEQIEKMMEEMRKQYCRCGPEYTERGLENPLCDIHDIEESIRGALTSAYNAGRADALEDLSSWGNARMRNFHESELHGKIELMLRPTDQV